MGMIFFESWIITQKPTVETVGYVMEMMFFESWITDFHPGQRGCTAFRHYPNISAGATEMRASRLYGTSTYRNEISRWDGVFCPCHVRANHYSRVRANHYSPNTPAHFISPLPGKQGVCNNAPTKKTAPCPHRYPVTRLYAVDRRRVGNASLTFALASGEFGFPDRP